jgi:hypothetical protein
VSPIHSRLFGGKSTPATRAIIFSLTLALAVFRVGADHANHSAAVNHFALHANLLYRCPNLHFLSPTCPPLACLNHKARCVRLRVAVYLYR